MIELKRKIVITDLYQRSPIRRTMTHEEHKTIGTTEDQTARRLFISCTVKGKEHRAWKATALKAEVWAETVAEGGRRFMVA